jgi:hypothetical protein
LFYIRDMDYEAKGRNIEIRFEEMTAQERYKSIVRSALSRDFQFMRNTTQPRVI